MSEAKTAEKPVVTGTSAARVVFHCQVRAFSGRGTVTAVVVGKAGEARLYGATNLVECGLLPARHSGRYVQATTLAGLLRVPLVKGKEACTRWLAENKVKGIEVDDIIADAVGGDKRSAAASIADF